MLERVELTGQTKKEMYEKLDDIKIQYQEHIKSKAIVEDMINDFKLVDVEFLKWYHYINGTKNPSTSKYIQTISKDIKLKL